MREDGTSGSCLLRPDRRTSCISLSRQGLAGEKECRPGCAGLVPGTAV